MSSCDTIKDQQTKPTMNCKDDDNQTVNSPHLLSPQQRCELALFDAYKYRLFAPLDVSNIKKTYCYSMQYDINIIAAYCYICINNKNIINIIHSFFTISFVKIYEDNQFKPLKIVKQLQHNPLKQQLSPDLIIPLDANRIKNIKTGSHKYDIVRYDFIHHVTLETIALKTIQNKQLNPLYFTQNRKHPWIALEYKLKMLYIFQRVIQIVINMYHQQLVDLDISPDNFIIKTHRNGEWLWKDVIATNCIKIDHESMSSFSNGILFAYQMNKPMKSYCIPPELSAYTILNTPNKIINIEQFSIYQITATFIYILFGQCQINGLWYTLDVDNSNNINERTLEWSPKLDIQHDLAFLNDCLSVSPSKRPSFDLLKQYVLNSIEITTRTLQSITGNLPRKITKRRNNLYAEYNHCYNNNGGAVEIIYNPQSSQKNGFNQFKQETNGYYDEQRHNTYIDSNSNGHNQQNNDDEGNNSDDDDAVNYE